MQKEFLSARRSELTTLAEERGVEFREALRSVQEDDDVRVISVLATLLELDIAGVFNAEASIEEVERHSRRLLEGQMLQFDNQRAEAERQLRNMPREIRVKFAEQLEAAASALREE